MERKSRLGAGAAQRGAAAFASVSRAWRIGFAVVGAVGFVTGTLRYWAINGALGNNTCRAHEQ